MSIRGNRRIDIIGFNDFWFVVIGTVVTSLITDFLFNGGSFLKYSLGDAFVNWSISWLFAICNWLIMRKVMIVLRKWYPDFKDNIKRITLLFLLIILTIIVIDRFGSFTLGKLFGDDYHHPAKSQLLLPILTISIMILAIYEAIYYYKRLQNSIREEE